jgi:catechol 2,3-dioxygenase-like lactoylglutathione lyase family enzyme
MTGHGWNGAAPVFRVSSLSASLDYYLRVLGFSVDWNYQDSIASVSRDRCFIFLCQDDQGHSGVWAWIGVPDVEELHREITPKGARIRNPPANFAWALEMQVEDLDGNVLRIGSEPIPGRPFGPWKDMHGALWDAGPEGEWKRRS